VSTYKQDQSLQVRATIKKGNKREIIIGRRKGCSAKNNIKVFEVEIFAMQQWRIDLQKRRTGQLYSKVYDMTAVSIVA
jgi:hypothetical protein